MFTLAGSTELIDNVTSIAEQAFTGTEVRHTQAAAINRYKKF